MIILLILQGEENLRIIPQRTIHYVVEGEQLELTCIHVYSGTTPDDVSFRKDGALLTSDFGYHV